MQTAMSNYAGQSIVQLPGEPALLLRPIEVQDLAFLEQLYASTRESEFSAVSWPAPAKQAFLRQQFQLQHDFYQAHFPDAALCLIYQNDKAIGRLYWRWERDMLRIIDIALTPEHRGRGLGTAILQAFIQQAEQQQKRIELHVENFNPALRLYQRLGFEKRGENGVYQRLAWTAATS